MHSEIDRRQMLTRCGTGIGLLGLTVTAAQAGLLEPSDNEPDTAVRNPPTAGRTSTQPLAPRAPHFTPAATRLVHLFMNGGPSHVDTFDPKPLLKKYHGKPLSSSFKTERKTGAAMGSPFKFRRYGESGLEISELFDQTAQHADELCVIRSMYADVPNHEPSLMLMNCGDGRLPRPSFGSWLTYGLGSENQNLPGFVVLCPKGYPIVATRNWRSAFLPGAYQGTYVDSQHTDVRKLIENIRHPRWSLEEQRRQLNFVQRLNRRHRDERLQDADLQARTESFELAYRMQMEATDAFDLSKESKQTWKTYGEGQQARQLVITRRLLERGVRVVQVWSGAGQPWDNHADLEKNHRNLAQQWDQALAGFLTDLKQRGLLESTLVQWGGEFGRTPTAELPALSGRDHNHYGFTCWLAGGGARRGYCHGATDETGFRAVQDRVHVHDLHATMLHLLGFDHQRLTYRYAGRDFRFTDVHGRVVQELLQV